MALIAAPPPPLGFKALGVYKAWKVIQEETTDEGLIEDNGDENLHHYTDCGVEPVRVGGNCQDDSIIYELSWGFQRGEYTKTCMF